MSFKEETERLILRDVTETDLPVLIAQATEPAARRGLLAHQSSEKYARAVLTTAVMEAGSRRRRNFTLSVVRKSDGAILGSASVGKLSPRSIETSLGWHYGARYWGKGYGTEAARALLDIGFEVGHVAEIYADCFADNYASIRIMQKIGMSERANLQLFNQIRGWSYGERRPTVRFVITRREWFEKQLSEI